MIIVTCKFQIPPQKRILTDLLRCLYEPPHILMVIAPIETAVEIIFFD